jgi:hypothetical protein
MKLAANRFYFYFFFVFVFLNYRNTTNRHELECNFNVELNMINNVKTFRLTFLKGKIRLKIKLL